MKLDKSFLTLFVGLAMHVVMMKRWQPADKTCCR